MMILDAPAVSAALLILLAASCSAAPSRVKLIGGTEYKPALQHLKQSANDKKNTTTVKPTTTHLPVTTSSAKKESETTQDHTTETLPATTPEHSTTPPTTTTEKPTTTTEPALTSVLPAVEPTEEHLPATGNPAAVSSTQEPSTTIDETYDLSKHMVVRTQTEEKKTVWAFDKGDTEKKLISQYYDLKDQLNVRGVKQPIIHVKTIKYDMLKTGAEQSYHEKKTGIPASLNKTVTLEEIPSPKIVEPEEEEEQLVEQQEESSTSVSEIEPTTKAPLPPAETKILPLLPPLLSKVAKVGSGGTKILKISPWLAHEGVAKSA